MSMDLKADILNAVMESKFIKNKCKTPKFRKPTAPPQYNPPPMPQVKPPNTGSSIQSSKKHCIYSTPCGWCTKWDKKCDKRIGGGNDTEPRKKKDAELEYIKSGKEMSNDMGWFL